MHKPTGFFSRLTFFFCDQKQIALYAENLYPLFQQVVSQPDFSKPHRDQ